MECLFNQQTQFTLHSQLSSFGLNPNEWVVDLSQQHVYPVREKSGASKSMMKNIVIRNVLDKSFHLSGTAQIKRLGRAIKTTWLQLSFNE